MNLNDAQLLAGRFLLGMLFILASVAKILTPAPFIAHMAQHHIDGLLLPGVIALELFGGLAIVLGWRLSYTALVMALFCIATALIFHFNFADKAERSLLFKDLAIAGGLIILATRK